MKELTNKESETMPKEMVRLIRGETYRPCNRRRKTPPRIPEQQRDMYEYYKYLVSENPNAQSEATHRNALYCVAKFGSYFQKPFLAINKKDIQDFFYDLNSGNRNFKESTINEYRIKIRVFYRWLMKSEDYPDIVKDIKLSKKKRKRLDEDELLSKDDIKKLINAADNYRDKALVACLYESAARVSEFLHIQIKNVITDAHGIKLKLPISKTVPRPVRLIDSVPYLQDWLNNHPHNTKDAYLWVSTRFSDSGMPLYHRGILHLLKRLASRAKIGKNIYPHLFRHSRLDALARDGFNERDLQIIAGWSEESEMAKIYLHYNEKIVDQKLLRKAGVVFLEEEDIEKNKEVLKPRECPRCKLLNGATSKYCTGCGMTLNLKDYMKDQELIKEETDNRLRVYAEIMSDPEKRKKYEEFKEMIQVGL